MADAPAFVIGVALASAGGGGPTDPPDPPEDSFEGTFVLSSPEHGTQSASGTPPFVVAVVPTDVLDTSTYTVEVQYAANTAFTGASTLSAVMNAVEGGVIVHPVSPVFATTSWRARLLQDGVQIHDWTEAKTFTVITAITASTVPVTWTVSPAAARPIHLWHLDPPGPEAGDTVTVYGQGFPASGHLSFGGQPLSVASWQRVAALAANTTDDRSIDGETVTCEHYEVSFVAPDYDGPGDVLTVEA